MSGPDLSTAGRTP
jgi:hypothetical protein